MKADIWTSNKARFLLPSFSCTHIPENGARLLYVFRVARGGEEYNLTICLTPWPITRFFKSEVGLF